MRPWPRRLWGGAWVAALLGLASACRPSPPPSSRPTTLTAGVPFELDTLDPHARDRLSSFAVLFNVYEGLVDADADLRIRPSLATSWESPDPLTWVFHLRPSVTFHSGRPLRAADVVYSLARVRRSTTLEIRNFTRTIAEVTATDALTVRIRTATPTVLLLAALRHVAIVPEGSTEETLTGAADGTGPYRLASWVPGQELTLRSHVGHWSGTTRATEVRLVLGQGEDVLASGLRDGRFQIVRGSSRALAAAVAGSPSHTLLEQESLYVNYLAYDLGGDATPYCRVRPNPFRDLRVRQAVAAAVDRRAMVTRLSSDATVAYQPVPRSVLGFAERLPEPTPDPEAARALLREAGLGQGFDVVLHARPFVQQAAQLLSADLRRVGIRAEVQPVTDAEHFERLRRKDLTLWLTRIGCDTGDAAELFEDLIHSPDPSGRYGSLNDSGYRDPVLDAAIERSVTLEKPKDRSLAFQRIMGEVVARQVLLPLYTPRDVWGLDRSLSWRPRHDGELRLAEVTLGPSTRPN